MDLDALVPAWFAAKRMGVSRQVFHYWRTSGKIHQAVDENDNPCVDEQGRPLYRYRDVLAADRSARRSGKSHRNPRGLAA